MPVFLRRRWTVKPPVGTPLARDTALVQGLVAAYALNERGATCYDLVTRRNHLAFTSPTWGARIGTFGPLFDGTGNQYLKNASPVGLPGQAAPFSIYVRCALTSTTQNQKIIARWDDSGSQLAWLVDAGADVASRISLYVVLGGTNGWWCTSSNNYSTAHASSIVASSDGTLNTALTIILDGVRTSGQTNSLASGFGAASPGLSIGAGLNGAAVDNPMTGVVEFAAIWNRVLRLGEAWKLYERPWILMAPPSPRVRYFFPNPVAPSGASGPLVGVGRLLGRGRLVA